MYNKIPVKEIVSTNNISQEGFLINFSLSLKKGSKFKPVFCRPIVFYLHKIMDSVSLN